MQKQLTVGYVEGSLEAGCSHPQTSGDATLAFLLPCGKARLPADTVALEISWFQVTVMKWGSHLRHEEMQNVPLSRSTLPHTPLPSTDTHVQMSCITVLPDRLHLGFERWTEIICSVSTALYSLER